ncbi:AMIN-like domain-containing (lipo)protein [Cellulomonas shaoxiangyii]|uniref:AMIN-like domain-containing protein n=1 Tax=Cellulomonas shaoxiangyii TaxID=2566013 RepID=A0A4P7SLZ6_9CELL|nr:hypothetical protein [Cellulomonas shaoxiangyii]QCB94216.1 hypothetical protein E5225_12240 [Cellulomonas shaoxiangyii]TGY86709.1 hypothetical protein E5226_01200 [Cellulomonas shaoxiangyii]
MTAVVGLVVLATAACGDGGAGTTTPSATPTPTATATPSPGESATASPTAPRPTATGTPEPTAGLGDFTPPGTELTAEPVDGRLTVVAVRTGEHDDYDRVVYELAGEGLPGWRVGWVDQAVDDPSGEVVPVEGDGILQVWITGTAYPHDSGHDEFAQDLHPDDGDVEQVTRPLTFEGMTQSFIGVDDGPRPVRVLLLQDPVRVVVDVADDA